MEERGRKIARTKIGGVWGEQLLPIPLIYRSPYFWFSSMLYHVNAWKQIGVEFYCLFSFTPTVKRQYAVFSTLRVI